METEKAGWTLAVRFTAVNGTAAGGGLSLAIAGDIVIGAESSKYVMAYSAIGLSPDGGATHRLPRLIGMRLTQEMAFLNRSLDAGEALQSGLITRIVADDALDHEALEVASKIARGPTVSLGRIKRLLAESANQGLAAQLDHEAASIIASAGTRDAEEGINAFLQQRGANFLGH